MTILGATILIVLGALLTWSITGSVLGISLTTIGIILMAVGVFLVFLFGLGVYGRDRRGRRDPMAGPYG